MQSIAKVAPVNLGTERSKSNPSSNFIQNLIIY
jgi:hypothetical protein